MLLEEDESKPVVNPTDSSSVFLGPKQVRARALDIPPMVPPPDVSPPLAGHGGGYATLGGAALAEKRA